MNLEWERRGLFALTQCSMEVVLVAFGEGAICIFVFELNDAWEQLHQPWGVWIGGHVCQTSQCVCECIRVQARTHMHWGGGFVMKTAGRVHLCSWVMSLTSVQYNLLYARILGTPLFSRGLMLIYIENPFMFAANHTGRGFNIHILYTMKLVGINCLLPATFSVKFY